MALSTPAGAIAHTVLGPVPAAELGVTAVHEALLSVVPGAEHAFDITFDRAEIFDTLAAGLNAFREAGGRTIVDATGMFHGRDLALYEALSRTTGVHIIASTGMGPENMLGGYFLTPQTNPPTPWPAAKFAELFAQEITEGMVVPRVERRAPAGIVTTAADPAGMTPTEESLIRGAARAAKSTGVPMSLSYGADAIAELDVALDEGLDAERILVGGVDRKDAVAGGTGLTVARRGAFIAIDHIGSEGNGYVSDAERATLVAELVAAGQVDRIILSSSATGVAKGHDGCAVAFDHILTTFVPMLTSSGVGDADVTRILVDNPRTLLSVR